MKTTQNYILRKCSFYKVLLIVVYKVDSGNKNLSCDLIILIVTCDMIL